MKPSFTLTDPCDCSLPLVSTRGTSNGCGSPETASVIASRRGLIGLTDLGSLPGILTPFGRVWEPTLERKGSFSEVVFAK